MLSLLMFLSIFLYVFVGSAYLFDILTQSWPSEPQAFANEIPSLVFWCMVKPIAAIFVPRVGSATIGEVLLATC